MKIIRTDIPDVLIVEPDVYSDCRGWFMESFSEAKFHQALENLHLPVPGSFVQDNHSFSKKGVLRGLHYQLPPYAQGKLVRVTSGSAYDVAVDVRKNSPTFGKWVGVELSSINQRILWIPEGFAHGFVALEENTEFLYKTTTGYHKASERSIAWNDPSIGIAWPLVCEELISEKDKAAPLLKNSDVFQFGFPGSFEQVELKVIGDERGSLIALEQGRNVPFDIKRVYYIFDTLLGVSRGFHAHRQLVQMVVCVSGKCRIVLDDGAIRESVVLSESNKALIIRNMIWREMHDFSDDCVLMVFASEHYNEADYIRNYDQFMIEVNAGGK